MHRLIAEHAEDETVALRLGNLILEAGGHLVSITDKGGPACGVSEGRFIVWSEWSSEDLLAGYQQRTGVVRETESKMLPDDLWWEKKLGKRLDKNDPFPFGKHKGELMWSVDIGFYRWLMTQEWCTKYPQVVDYVHRTHPELVTDLARLRPEVKADDSITQKDLDEEVALHEHSGRPI